MFDTCLCRSLIIEKIVENFDRITWKRNDYTLVQKFGTTSILFSIVINYTL